MEMALRMLIAFALSLILLAGSLAPQDNHTSQAKPLRCIDFLKTSPTGAYRDGAGGDHVYFMRSDNGYTSDINNYALHDLACAMPVA